MFKAPVSLFKCISGICLLLTVSFNLEAQNLVPNPGFEKNKGCPGPFVYLTNTENWKSVDNHSGTPDLFWSNCPYNGIGEKNLMAKNQMPYEGIGFIGVFAHGDKLREYCTVELTETLEKGKKYKVEFWVRPANGYGTAINSFGLHFSTSEVKSETSGSLAFIPLKEHISNPPERMLSDTSKWVSISGEYLASGGEQFITIGNFKRDEETKSEIFKINSIRSDRSYILIDNVTVEALDKTEKIVKEIKKDSIALVKTKIPTIVKGVFYAQNSAITLSLWDHNVEDGDSIDLTLNNEFILQKFRLTRKIYKLNLNLTDSVSILKVIALNLGSKPPNTVSVLVSDGVNSKRIILNSNLSKSEALKIIYTKPEENE